jgi:hypothetical protein
MDPKENNEARVRRREELLARRLAEALDQKAPQTASDCPEADMIAAYADQALGPDESARCENHFAGCARCRTILHVLTASADTPLAQKEVARLGELVTATRASAPAATPSLELTRPKFIGWRIRWLAPALGLAAAVAVLLVLRPPWRATDRGPSGTTLVAQAPNAELQPSAPTLAENGAARESASQDTKTESAPAAKKEIEPRAQVQRSALQAARPNSPAAPAAGTQDKSDDGRNSVEAQTKTAPLAPQPAPPPAVSADANAATNRQFASRAPGSTAQSVVVTEAAPVVQQENSAVAGAGQPKAVAELPLNGRDFQPLARLKATGVSSLLKAPSGQIVWRVGAAGSIQRSVDAGRTWTPQASPSSADWLSGTAVSATVAWVGGRQGAIARTLDGENWQTVPPPAQSADAAGKLPDWLAVAARDAQSATVTAGDGRRFTTQDGGKSWQMQ